ncbi:Hypothetical_protein [Hexamita inflata]|uniref:Hypothetical_protein n=1 Tax=Hexamita inflata TaxID=28002 RepID=A0ABP1GHR1_9EUKA
MNQQEKHDKRVLDLYKNHVQNNSLTIEQSDLVQNIQFVDQLPINTLYVRYSYDIRFDRVPSKITSLYFDDCPKTNFTGFEQMKQLKILYLPELAQPDPVRGKTDQPDRTNSKWQRSQRSEPNFEFNSVKINQSRFQQNRRHKSAQEISEA